MSDIRINEIHAILCDFDGTLADTSEANFLAYSEALFAYGIKITRGEFEQVSFGRNWRQFLPKLIQDAKVNADPALIAKHKREIYQNYQNAVNFNNPLWSLIQNYKKTTKTAIVTTASRDSLKAALKNVEINNYFDLIIDGDHVKNHKPAPDAYLLAAEKLGIKPENCLVFEDSEIGIQSAKNANMQFIRIQFP